MKKILFKFFKRIQLIFINVLYNKNNLKNNQFKNGGVTKIFNNDFYFHHNSSFRDTYKEIFLNNIYEFKTENSKPIIIDCGSNMGLSILYFSKKYPSAAIIAFEPDPFVLPYLEKNIKSNKLNNVRLIPKAVWTKETKIKFYSDYGMGGRIEIEYANQIPKNIETVRLRDFLNTEIDMLKIDIEGSEYNVLKDCVDRIHNVKNIFIEYHSFENGEQHLDDILNILKTSGFRYHLKESYSQNRPFIDKVLVCEKFDMAINIFAYKN